MALQVIGAGLARTGTMSMKAALTQLGFGRCYHMIDLLGNPQDVPYWEAASRGEAVDWESLFHDCKSTIDYPGCRYYKQYMELYPEAKVVLTVRNPETWYESTRDTVYSVQSRVFDEDGNPRPGGSPFPGDPALQLRVMQLLRNDMWQGDYQGRFEDRDFVLDFWHDWVADVKASVPADRLLVFQVTEGWGPLCEFLDVPIPDTPFPRLNDRQAFQERLNTGDVTK